MDGFPPHGDDSERDIDYASEPPPLVRFDERRMHVRAYNYWASLLGERIFPSIEDLNPEELEDFGPNSVLLDFTSGFEDPAIAFLGTALRDECGLSEPITRISQVPPRTLLSRLTDHYMQIIANEAPIGFEAEFTNQRGSDILYRGILMPFSSDDDSIDFIYGVINWKEVAAPVLTDELARAVNELEGTRPSIGIEQMWGFTGVQQDAASAGYDDTDTAFDGADGEIDALELDTFIDPLGKALNDARRAAVEATAFEQRSHQALYRAIALAYSFALIADTRPDDYAELLTQAGIVVQPAHPTTALVKLVFGSSYDKSRLSECALIIDHARNEAIAPDALPAMLAAQPDGIKGLVRSVRAARRGDAPVAAAKGGARLRKRLSRVPPVALESIATDDDGFALVLVRRDADGVISALGGLPADHKAAAAAMRTIARDRG